MKPFADDPEGLLEGRSAAVPDGLEGVPDGRLVVPYEGLDAGVPDDGLFTLPDGRVALEPDGRDDDPLETAGDFRVELFDEEDLCTDVDRDDPEDVRDAPFLVCAYASDWKPNNAEPSSREANIFLIDPIVNLF